MRPPVVRLALDEIIVDSFAGGGGASLGIEQAFGRSPDIAINHDREAIAMHAVNHPSTRHHCEDVWAVDPVEACGGKRVGLMWLSPDCTFHSKARGSKPFRDRNPARRRRGLAWIAVRWARALGPNKPRVIILENVEEFADWGPVTEDGKPCPLRKGLTFRRFVKQLQNCGYDVDWQELRACDYGAPTIRKRLFLVARCDGQPIVWPAPTHGRGLIPWRTAAECIDWALPCPSIFERVRPLAENTLRRIANGIRRYVIEAAEPFIVPVAHQGDARTQSVDEPLRTVTGAHRGEHALVTPFLAGYHSPKRDGDHRTHDLADPLPTQSTENRYALVTPFLTEHANGSEQRNFSAAEPLRTQCAEVKGGHFALVAPCLAGVGGRAGQSRPRGANEPTGTLTGKADVALVAPVLVGAGGPGYSGKPKRANAPLNSATAENHTAVIAAFLAQHNTDNVGHDARDPVSTIVGKGCTQGLVSAFLTKHFGDKGARGRRAVDVREPMPTMTGIAKQTQVTTAILSHAYTSNTCGGNGDPRAPMKTIVAGGTHHGLVKAFLMKYYRTEQDPKLRSPLGTVTARDRFGLVTVAGEEYAIADIGMRMLQPRELFRAQGFPDSYHIEADASGKPFTKTAQVRMCGNSVCPPVAAAVIAANFASVSAEAVA